MLIKLMESLNKNLAFPALLISAGLLILVANRDAFDVDSKPRDVEDPTGPTRQTWMWKYMSDYAEYARLELLHLLRFLRLATLLMLLFCAGLFTIGILVGVADWLGYKEFALWWENNSAVELYYGHAMPILFILLGPVMIYRLARVVSNIVRARDVPAEGKPPGWTPY